MAKGSFILEKRFFCSCGWYGKENEIAWSPFNPIDTFLRIDIKNNPNNPFAFKQICPKCRSDEHLKFNTF